MIGGAHLSGTGLRAILLLRIISFLQGIWIPLFIIFHTLFFATYFLVTGKVNLLGIDSETSVENLP